MSGEQQIRHLEGSDRHAADHGPTFAAIDIGSHTIRMVIARLEEKQEIVPLRVERRITRLAKNFDAGQTLKEASLQESMSALTEYASLLRQHQVHSVACGATGVVRRAANGADFLGSIEETTGIRGSILSEAAEAYLSAKGILSVLPQREGLILSFDLGGSSTEFLLIDGRHPDPPLWSTSVFIGASTITERYLSGDPPQESSLRKASEVIRDALLPVFSTLSAYMEKADPASLPLQVAGTAGTVTTLASIYLKMTAYEPYRVNGLLLTEDWLQGAIELLARMPLSSRRNIPGLEKGREEIILGGALIVRQILKGIGKKEITITDGGLLEGLLLNCIEEDFGWPHSLSTHLTWKRQKG